MALKAKDNKIPKKQLKAAVVKVGKIKGHEQAEKMDVESQVIKRRKTQTIELMIRTAKRKKTCNCNNRNNSKKGEKRDSSETFQKEKEPASREAKKVIFQKTKCTIRICK